MLSVLTLPPRSLRAQSSSHNRADFPIQTKSSLLWLNGQDEQGRPGQLLVVEGDQWDTELPGQGNIERIRAAQAEVSGQVGRVLHQTRLERDKLQERQRMQLAGRGVGVGNILGAPGYGPGNLQGTGTSIVRRI